MLALTRSIRAAHILSLHARTHSTIAHSTDSLNTDTEQSTHDYRTAGTRRRRSRLANPSAECMLVYPWNEIRSSAEGLAIAQAVQDKYGPAKEVVFSRNVDSVSVFQPYFWLIYDDPRVIKRLPEENTQITLHVADLPGDDNVGVEEMMRGLGLYETDNKDTSSPPTETNPSKSANDVPPEGYKTLEVRVERANSSPREIHQRHRVYASLRDQETRLEFAKAWLAFGGFSPESARGPQTPNLLRAHEKWRKLAPPVSARKDDGDDATTAAELVPPEEVEAGTESMTEPRTNEISSREWVPIISTLHSQQRPRPDSASSKNIRYEDGSNAFTPTNPDNSHFNAALATSAAEAAAGNTTTTDATPTPTVMPARTEKTAAKQAQVGAAKLSRRERILNLARQNARTPLPKLPEMPQPPPETEKIDEESERQGKERTIRERLWRLVGGNF